uniref:Saposin B-type domain-containing protein n=1 Tax=Glossina palpalis gambiensis TaxID=67801 RepID=A0A1B0BRS9_9MUSC
MFKLRILCLMLTLSVANLMTKPIHSLVSVMRTKRNKKLGCELCDDFVTTTKYNASETAKYNSSWNSLLLHYMDAQQANTYQHNTYEYNYSCLLTYYSTTYIRCVTLFYNT